MNHWTKNSFFYHIYPLGFCNAPKLNWQEQGSINRIQKMSHWLNAIQDLGANALYLGPIFESVQHGYDTSDYYWVDRRLGTNEDFRLFSEEVHSRGMRLVLDGVFNHVGRNFWAFQDMLKNGQGSPYVDWFVDVDFNKRSPMGDYFSYAVWEGQYSLPKLNLHNADVRKHLLDAVLMWMHEFGIDGLRLDAADCVEDFFWKELHQVTKAENPEFWLMGEIIHGDYRRWVNETMFDSVTNYAAYKGLWSSLNDANYHEIAYTLTQEFGSGGMYVDLLLYNFVDNHDVDRIASQLKSKAHLYPLYLLLFTMPGIPSIYYGSEFAVEGRKADGDDTLRQSYEIESLLERGSTLRDAIQLLSWIRNHSSALRTGTYEQCLVTDRQFAFWRRDTDEIVLVILNADENEVSLKIPMNGSHFSYAIDNLNHDEKFVIENGTINCTVSSNWGRIFRFQ